jgi:hypothetical protein
LISGESNGDNIISSFIIGRETTKKKGILDSLKQNKTKKGTEKYY